MSTEKFEIFYNDLNDDAKNRFLQFMHMSDPREGNYDINFLPLAIVEVESDIIHEDKSDPEISIFGGRIAYDGVELIDLEDPDAEPIRAIFINENYPHLKIMENLFSRFNFKKPMFVYDVREDDAGHMCTIEPQVWVNFGGTLITNKKLLGPDEIYARLVQDPEDVKDDPNYQRMKPRYDYNFTGEEFYPGDFENYLYDTFPTDDMDTFPIIANTVEDAFNMTIGYYNNQEVTIGELLDHVSYPNLSEEDDAEARKILMEFFNDIDQ